MKRVRQKECRYPGSSDERPGDHCSLASLPSSHCCTIIESITEGVFTIDLQKTITYFNPAAEVITGFSSGEAVGQKCFDIFRADICEKRCPMDKSLATGKPELHPRVTLISKSGSEMCVSMSTSPLKDEGGRIVGGDETVSYFETPGPVLPSLYLFS